LSERGHCINAWRLLYKSKVLHKIVLSRRVESSRLLCVRFLFAGWYMTQRNDVARDSGHGPDLGARWRGLAERRLEYLTELFESGRWRRYYSERAFLENIQEAKAAVAHWRDLSKGEALYTQMPPTAINVIERSASKSVDAIQLAPPSAPIILETPKAMVVVAADDEASSDEMLPPPTPEPEQDGEPTMSPDRFALLRNML